MTIFTLGLVMAACGEAGPAADVDAPVNDVPAVTDTASQTVDPNPVDDGGVVSRYQYDKEWDLLKEALLNKDKEGIAAFVKNTDEVDIDMLLMVMDNEPFMNQLKTTTFADLQVEDTDKGVQLSFHAEETGMDDEGNEVGSAITIYFIQGEPSLELVHFIAAG